MKILVYAPYIFDPPHSEFMRNKTGFGFMVNDICSYTGKINDVYYLGHVITDGYKNENFTVLKHSKTDILKCFTPANVFRAVRYAFSVGSAPVKARIRLAYCSLNALCLLSYCKKLKPDVVHIHGATADVRPMVDMCKRKRIPFVVTLHGKVNTLEHVSEYDKKSELYVYTVSPYVTTISTGIRNCLNSLTGRDGKNIFVVGNGTDISASCQNISLNIREKYGIDSGKKIVLSVGNLSPWKNQIQTVRALASMTDAERNRICVLLVGNDFTNGEIVNAVKENYLEDCVKICGFIERPDIYAFYEQCDCVLLASIEEGFGLSVIEGYVHGKPGIIFDDVDAAADLSDDNALYLVHDRNDISLADAIKFVLKKKWDCYYIKKFAYKFSLENMADKYLSVYEKIVADRMKSV